MTTSRSIIFTFAMLGMAGCDAGPDPVDGELHIDALALDEIDEVQANDEPVEDDEPPADLDLSTDAASARAAPKVTTLVTGDWWGSCKGGQQPSGDVGIAIQPSGLAVARVYFGLEAVFALEGDLDEGDVTLFGLSPMGKCTFSGAVAPIYGSGYGTWVCGKCSGDWELAGTPPT